MNIVVLTEMGLTSRIEQSLFIELYGIKSKLK